MNDHWKKEIPKIEKQFAESVCRWTSPKISLVDRDDQTFEITYNLTNLTTVKATSLIKFFEECQPNVLHIRIEIERFRMKECQIEVICEIGSVKSKQQVVNNTAKTNFSDLDIPSEFRSYIEHACKILFAHIKRPLRMVSVMCSNQDQHKILLYGIDSISIDLLKQSMESVNELVEIIVGITHTDPVDDLYSFLELRFDISSSHKNKRMKKQ